MALSSVGMRMTPQRTTIVMKKNPLKLAEEGCESPRPSGEFKTRSAAGDIAAGQVGMLQADDKKYAAAVEEFGEDVLCNEYGRPIVDREMAYLPDPRYSNSGHTVFALLWYGGFLLAIAYIAWVFVTYEPEQNSAVYMTGALAPRVNLDLRFSCSGGGTTPLMVFQVYPEGSACYNASAPAPPAAPIVVAPSPLGAADAGRMTVSLCDTPHTEYNPNDGAPTLNGVFVKFINITEDNLCQIDVYPQIGSAAAATRPIKRLSVENNIMKTFYMSYWRKREKHVSWFGTSPPTYTMLDEKLVGRYYELDAARQYSTGPTAAPDTSSVIALRYHDTANDVTVFDMRSWVKAGGIFGTLWYMISAYACFWAAPLLICTFPRDLIAEAKAGKLDGYTDNALKDAWRPTVWLWIGGELIKRISYAGK
jgi:hypothetical protein